MEQMLQSLLKQKNPRVTLTSDRGVLTFTVLMEDGSVGAIHITDDLDGYYNIVCSNVIKSPTRISKTKWLAIANQYQLVAGLKVIEGTWYGMLSMRIKPGNEDDLYNDMVTFITRTGLVVKSWHQK